jgi:hypothetical protein
LIGSACARVDERILCDGRERLIAPWMILGVIHAVGTWMLKRYGEKALDESATRAEELRRRMITTAPQSGAASPTP